MERDATPTPAKGDARDETGLLDVLTLLIEARKAKTTADLVKYAAQYGAPDAEQRLRVLEAEGIPLQLAFDAISVHLRILHYKRSSQLVASCRGKRIGIVLPAPHHLLDLFQPVAEVELLHPGDAPLHGPVQDLEKIVKGTRACRAAAERKDVLVFEAYRDGAVIYVDGDVADVLEPKLLPAGVQLLAHLRPHRNPQDVAFAPGSKVSFV